MNDLVRYMTGNFSSEVQHLASPEDFFDIRLKMVPIWTDRDDGPWLYVEQAAAIKEDRPYRQRVYRLIQLDDGTIESRVYTLPGDSLRFTGAWQNMSLLAEVTPTDLALREGCSIYLTRMADGSFVGTTLGHDCESTLAGAAYAASEATITANRLVSWDRGYSEEGKQVWGAEKGGYEFVKINE